jgi:DNA-binding YbaB/EbfC family protein
MFNKLKQFKDLRDQAKHLQDELEKEFVTTNAAGNQVVLTINGNLTITGLAIDDALMTPANKEKLVNGIKDAHSDALKKMQRTLALKMREMGGLPNIPGFN